MRLLATGVLGALLICSGPDATAQTTFAVLPAKVIVKGTTSTPGGVSPTKLVTRDFVNMLYESDAPAPKHVILALLATCIWPASLDLELVAWDRVQGTASVDRWSWEMVRAVPATNKEVVPGVAKLQEVLSGSAWHHFRSLSFAGRMTWARLPRKLDDDTVCPARFKGSTLTGQFSPPAPVQSIYSRGKITTGKPIASFIIP